MSICPSAISSCENLVKSERLTLRNTVVCAKVGVANRPNVVLGPIVSCDVSVVNWSTVAKTLCDAATHEVGNLS